MRRTGGLGRRTLTVGQAATLCDVSHRTVHKWCDSGILHCSRLPAGKHRRIERNDLLAFAEAYGLHQAADALRAAIHGEKVHVQT